MLEIFEYIKSQISVNQFLSGAVLGGLVLGALHELRHLPGRIYDFVIGKITITLTIDVMDRLYPYMRQFVSGLKYDGIRKAYFLASQDKEPDTYYSEPPGKPVLFPATGTYYAKYKKTWIQISTSRQEPKAEGAVFNRIYENITLKFFIWNRRLVDDIVGEIEALKVKEVEQGVAVKTPAYGGEQWNKVNVLPFKSPDTVISPHVPELISDIEAFHNRKEWYLTNGIPYHRGYLLTGPPGTGKSSTVHAIASHFKKDIFYLTYSSEMTDRHLMTAMGEIDPGGVILMEQVDNFFSGQKSDSKVNFSTLLDCLDGLTAKSSTILFMTTNHPDKLDPALIRPGRIDKVVDYGLATAEQIKKLFEMFYLQDGSRFAALVEPGKHSPAHLRNYFLCNPTPELAYTNIKTL